MVRTTAVVAAAAALISAPAHADTIRQEFEQPKAVVYAALIEALPAAGYKIDDQSPTLFRVSVKAPMSAWSFGERISIGISTGPSGGSVLEYTGAPVMSSNVVARGRVVKHFDRIVGAVADRLAMIPAP